MEFEVESAEAWARRQRVNRIFLSVAAAFLSLLSALALARYVSRDLVGVLSRGTLGPGFWWDTGVNALIWGITLVSVWGGLFLSAPPPMRVGVDAEAVRFVYGSGAERVLRWEDPKFRLDFTDLRNSADEDALFFVGRPLHEQARIPCRAALAIMDEAPRHGIEVHRSHPGFYRNRGAQVRMYRPS